MDPREVQGEPGPADARAEVQRLRSLLAVAQEFGRVSVWERDVETGEGRWDPHVFTLFGLAPAEEVPTLEAALRLVDPRDRARLRAEYAASLGVPGRHETRYRVRRGDGSTAYLHSIWQVPSAGRRIVGVLIDDTETVTLARRHAVARTHLGLLDKMVGLAVWHTDLASGRVYQGEEVWSAGADESAPGGISVEEYRAQLHPEDVPAVERARDEALAGNGPAVAECRVRDPDGGYRTLLTRRIAQRDAEGRPVGLLGVGIDVTEQVQARERYRLLLERFDMVVEATGVGVWTWDRQARTQEWNDALRVIYGLAPGSALPGGAADGVSDPVLAEDRAALEATLERVMQPDAPRVEVTYRIRRPDGALRALVGRVRQMADRPNLVCGIVLDVTELHAAQDALRDKEVAEQASRAKSAFLSRISHELRTPLNAMLGFGALLLDPQGEPLTAAQRERLQHMQRAGRHLLGLVDDLLHIGQDPQALGVERDRACDLTAVVDEVLAWHADAAREAGVRLGASGSCPPVRGGERHWRQVLANLVSNAIKYNRPGGGVQLTLRQADDPAWVELEVRDDGRGIDPALQPQLFEPFNRLGAERHGIPGTGLGLPIVRQLLRSLGGAMTLDSAPGAGTCVTLRLPCAGVAPAAAAEAPPLPPPPSAAAGVDVVYVEDNEVNVLLVREFLALRPQLRLHVAGSVAEGEALVRRLRPRLLLVDMHLPDGDGHTLLQRLGGRAGAGVGHCVALSADVMPDEVARARAGGFDDYWAKPIDLPEFLAGVDRLLAASG